jgi:hypothetical protein
LGFDAATSIIPNMYGIQSWGETLRLLVELSATAAFALSGLMEAARKRLDAVGVYTLALWRNWQLPAWRA